MAFSRNNGGPMQEIIFITAKEPMMIRMVDSLADTIARAARTLNARFIVASFDRDIEKQCPIWGVYDMNKATKFVADEMSLPLPMREFRTQDSDAAVMYAIAVAGR